MNKYLNVSIDSVKKMTHSQLSDHFLNAIIGNKWLPFLKDGKKYHRSILVRGLLVQCTSLTANTSILEIRLPQLLSLSLPCLKSISAIAI